MTKGSRRFIKLKHIISVPFIWSLIIPFLILDIWVEIYHNIGFRLYGIPLVKRSNYIVMDRWKLSYLKPLQRLGCTYCGYINGLSMYVTEIAHRSEKYWCGIMHRRMNKNVPIRYQRDFIKYGDKNAFERKLKISRAKGGFANK
jgi:hypothetical protein